MCQEAGTVQGRHREVGRALKLTYMPVFARYMPLCARCAQTSKEVDSGPPRGPHFGEVFPQGLMGYDLSLCLQLFLDDSKMKNFITCFKGTAAPSSPTFLTPSGKALEGSAPESRRSGKWASRAQEARYPK